MDHSTTLVTTIAAGFGLALIFGFLAERLKFPALTGYLLAGVVLGPSTPGIVADIDTAAQLSEIGVMLLMFGVGLHFSMEQLLSVRRIALPGAIIQMTMAALLGMGITHWWGWSPGEGLVLGLALSCASTVVLLRTLEARGTLDTMNSRIAIGWLVVEDLATVLVLVLMPPLAGVLNGTAAMPVSFSAIWGMLGSTLLQVSAFVALMLIAGRRVVPWLLWHVARTGSRELFTLSVITTAIGIALGAAKFFSVSFALGAFFAGMVLSESEFSHRAAKESLPFRDAFAVLFFVAVGMLFDPSVLLAKPLHVLVVVGIVILGNAGVAMLVVLALRYPLNSALTIGASLAQIGEFSFILAGLGLSLNLLPREGLDLVLIGSLISIAVNPFLFASIKPFRNWLLNRSDLARIFDNREDPYAELPMSTERKYLEGQVVLVGHGRVGRRIAAALSERGIPYVVAEQNREHVEALRKKGIASVSGDASDPSVLIQAHIANAAMLVIATPDPINVRHMIDTARKLNPNIEIVLRTHSENESQLLRKDNVDAVFYGEEELARGMASHVLERFAPSTPHAA